MSKDLNHVVIIGRLVGDPQIKYTPNGTAVTKFSIANNDSFTTNNETKEYANFFDVVVWGNQAINCEKYLKKGSQVAIDGNLKQNRWKDQVGNNRSKVEIVANRVQFLTPAQHNNAVNDQSQQQSNMFDDPWADQNNNDDIPY